MRDHWRRLLLLLVLGWPLLSVLANSGRVTRWMEQGATTAQMVGATALWAIVGVVASLLVWLPWRRWAARSSLSGGRLLALVVLCMAAGVAFEMLMLGLDRPIRMLPPPPDRAPPAAWTHAFVPGVALFSWLAVVHLLDTLDRLGRERERALEAAALATQARMIMLRNELNPHFLFNALNSINGDIDEDPPRAQEMVRQLAGLLRHTLRGPSVSTVEAEVNLARKYLAIEQMRFEERLQVEFQVPQALAGHPVPPMILQPLVENAIKHNMGGGTLALRIEVEAVDGVLLVRVLHPGRLGPLDRGVGLANLRDRLALLPEPGRVELTEHESVVTATITLPGARP